MLGLLSDMNDTLKMIDTFERQMREAPFAGSHRSRDGHLAFTDRGDSLVLTADLPGIAPDDLDISLEGDVLTLRAEKKSELPKGYRLVRSERQKVRVLRQIELPCRVDADAVQAKLDRGTLELVLPKAPEAKPRRIPVNGGTPKN